MPMGGPQSAPVCGDKNGGTRTLRVRVSIRQRFRRFSCVTLRETVIFISAEAEEGADCVLSI